MTTPETDWLTFLVPILCCALVFIPFIGRRGESQQPPGLMTDFWFTPLKIEETYGAIKKESDEWRSRVIKREKERSTSIVSRIRNLGRTPSPETRFRVQQDDVPRLYKLLDKRVGPIYFELTEVESGGTVVKASYGPHAKDRIVNFKAKQPLLIPTAPIGLNCPACGKALHREFNLCPYCGQKLIKE
jgi:hypothetical protein